MEVDACVSVVLKHESVGRSVLTMDVTFESLANTLCSHPNSKSANYADDRQDLDELGAKERLDITSLLSAFAADFTT